MGGQVQGGQVRTAGCGWPPVLALKLVPETLAAGSAAAHSGLGAFSDLHVAMSRGCLAQLEMPGT